jgi:hypothetical protein
MAGVNSMMSDVWRKVARDGATGGLRGASCCRLCPLVEVLI